MKSKTLIRKLRIQNNKLASIFGIITVVCAILTSLGALIQGFLREIIRTSSNTVLTTKFDSILKYSYPALVPISILAALGISFLKVINIEEVAGIFESLETQVEKLSRFKQNSSIEFKSLTSQQAAILSGMSALELILSSPDNYRNENEALTRIINPLVLLRNEALGFSNGGLYNFAVYKYNNATGLLTSIYRDYDKRIEVHNREWAPGEGHIGLSFQHDGPLIHADVASLKTITAPKKKFYDSDNIYYKSFISTPIIGSAEKLTDRLGVFVITSNKDDQFDHSHKYLANCYAILINLYYTEINKIMENENDGKKDSAQ